MNNRHDSNGKDFEGRMAGTGKPAGSSNGDQHVKNRRRDLPTRHHSGSPRNNGKSNRA